MEFMEGRQDAPVHFLGAMVLDQRQTQTGRVERRSVIDGQQRLTTFQIFLAAFRDFCRSEGLLEFAEECEKYTLNTGRMADPDVERYKVWPTLSDRGQFIDVISAGSRQVLEEKHPLVRRKYARKYEARPRMVEAYFFFHESLEHFFKGSVEEPAPLANNPLSDRVEECFEALKTALKVVAIDLDSDDDAQVIFETLNARGEPLLPADLLRNYIFLRAARGNEAQEALYRQYWAPFDEPFWRQEVVQGRLQRPRSDLFIQHYLASKQGRDIPIKHLFVEYKYWVEQAKPFVSVEAELGALAEQGKHYKRLVVRSDSDVLGGLASFLEIFDVSTAFPAMLAMLDLGADDEEMTGVSKILESYLLRRAICSAETKAYNRVFMALTRVIRREGAKASVVREHLISLQSMTDEWPDDARFAEAWMTAHAYHRLNNPRMVYVLGRLNDTYHSAKTEALHVNGALSVEHIMPQSWHQHWPLTDGSAGAKNPYSLPEDDPCRVATLKRNGLVQTFGNLTLITGGLNSAISNGPWVAKRAAIEDSSVLPLNLPVRNAPVWTEEAIEARGRNLLQRALKIWPRG
jgi:hypothetical protein